MPASLAHFQSTQRGLLAQLLAPLCAVLGCQLLHLKYGEKRAAFCISWSKGLLGALPLLQGSGGPSSRGHGGGFYIGDLHLQGASEPRGALPAPTQMKQAAIIITEPGKGTAAPCAEGAFPAPAGAPGITALHWKLLQGGGGRAQSSPPTTSPAQVLLSTGCWWQLSPTPPPASRWARRGQRQPDRGAACLLSWLKHSGRDLLSPQIVSLTWEAAVFFG